MAAPKAMAAERRHRHRVRRARAFRVAQEAFGAACVFTIIYALSVAAYVCG